MPRLAEYHHIPSDAVLVEPTGLALTTASGTARFTEQGTGVFDHGARVDLTDQMWVTEHPEVLHGIDRMVLLLSHLGSNRAAVARTLRKARVRGDKFCASCPLAVYAAQMGELVPVVFHDTISWWVDGEKRWRVVMDMPPGPRAFVLGFDAHELAQDLRIPA